MKFQFAKIVVYVPPSYADRIREVLAKAGAGHIGNYDYCSFSVKGVGRFRGGKGAKPFLGHPEKIEKVVEERIETIIPTSKIKKVLAAIKKVHPYEEPAIDIFPLLHAKQDNVMFRVSTK